MFAKVCSTQKLAQNGQNKVGAAVEMVGQHDSRVSQCCINHEWVSNISLKIVITFQPRRVQNIPLMLHCSRQNSMVGRQIIDTGGALRRESSSNSEVVNSYKK